MSHDDAIPKLRRGNLRTAAWEDLFQATDATVSNGGRPHAADSRTRRRSSEASIGASIKKKIREVTDVGIGSTLRRSKSTKSPSPSGSGPSHHSLPSLELDRRSNLKGKHNRSQSDPAPPHQQASHTSRALSAPGTGHGTSQDQYRVVGMESGNYFKVPPLLQEGTPMIKVSAKKKKTVVFKIDPDEGCILWESKKSGIITIENIKELRFGSDARYYREQFQISKDYEDKWLTIVYIVDGRYKTLHFVATTQDVYQMWDVTLRNLFAIHQELMSGLGHVEKRQAVWERRYWKGADEQGDQKLDFDEVENMCKRLNINFSRDGLMRRFHEADVQKRGYLDFPDFQRFVKLLKSRPELRRLFQKLCSSCAGVFSFDVFEKFMRECQKSSLSRLDLEKIFHKYASPTSTASPLYSDLSPSPSSSTSISCTSHVTSQVVSTEHHTGITSALEELPVPTLPGSQKSLIFTLDNFTSFLLSQDNSVFTDHHGRVWQDMTRPLSEYYISSSHNTYLVGHQLVGVSTIEGYIRALLHSCRSVELDIYDGDAEPVIYHGKTLTSKVPLRDTCEAIAKYAFVASLYPIIISAEVHCSLPQQDLIADIMRAVFGDALVTAPIDNRRTIEVLPSPEALKGRVLLKAKNLYVAENEELRLKSITVDAESSTETSTSESELLYEVKQELKHDLQKARNVEAIKDIRGEFRKARNIVDRVRRHKSPSPSNSGSPRIYSMSLPRSRSADRAERPKVKMSLELVALLVYTVGIKCRGFNKKEHYATEHVFSLSERTANKILKQGMIDLAKHNRTHVVRIYPNGTRLSSSNYEPHKYWSAGAQLVAINWQTFDLGYMINHAMFQRNGRAGYVLKPLALRIPTKDSLGKRTKHFFDVTIISAQQLPRPKDSVGREIIDKSVIDPYVEVSIHVPDWTHSPFLPETPAVYSPASSSGSSGAPSSARAVTYKTGVVKNNGFNPIWEEKLSLPFDCVGGMTDLVFVRFAVMDEHGDDDEPLAVYCISLGSIQEGYRHLPLHDTQLSQYLFSTLFVKIGIRDVEPM